MSTKYYLIEAPGISTVTGKVTGTSLRTYEVTKETVTRPGYNGNTYQDIDITPTGALFVYKDGIVTKKKTRATLSNKYVSGYHSAVAHRLEDIRGYGCTLFASPALALLAKAHAIKNEKIALEQSTAILLANIRENTKEHLAAHQVLSADYPEYLI